MKGDLLRDDKHNPHSTATLIPSRAPSHRRPSTPSHVEALRNPPGNVQRPIGSVRHYASPHWSNEKYCKHASSQTDHERRQSTLFVKSSSAQRALQLLSAGVQLILTSMSQLEILEVRNQLYL